MTLTKTQRETILTKIQSLVTEKYFDPSFNEAAWQEIVQTQPRSHRRRIRHVFI